MIFYFFLCLGYAFVAESTADNTIPYREINKRKANACRPCRMIEGHSSGVHKVQKSIRFPFVPGTFQAHTPNVVKN